LIHHAETALSCAIEELTVLLAAAIDVFKAKAVAGNVEQRELAGEVAKAEQMVTVLAICGSLESR
jgi:hypothetical protein